MTQADGRNGGYSIGEAARRAGVSVRTLRHYDQIGLLRPSRVTQAGYRVYDEDALLRLEQILFFRELGFPLGEIGRLMQNPAYDAREAMRRQRALLLAQRRRLDAMIGRLDRAMQGQGPAELEVFSMKEIEAMKAQYAEEARTRWGDTQAYAQSQAREAGYGKADWQRIQAGMDDLLRAFAQARDWPAQDARVQALVGQWQAYITDNFYACTDEILSGLGRMYVADERFTRHMDRFGEGTAACVARAIEVFCAQKNA